MLISVVDTRTGVGEARIDDDEDRDEDEGREAERAPRHPGAAAGHAGELIGDRPAGRGLAGAALHQPAGDHRGEKEKADGTVTFDVPADVSGQYIVVWFTELTEDDNGKRRARLDEVVVTG